MLRRRSFLSALVALAMPWARRPIPQTSDYKIGVDIGELAHDISSNQNFIAHCMRYGNQDAICYINDWSSNSPSWVAVDATDGYIKTISKVINP